MTNAGYQAAALPARGGFAYRGAAECPYNILESRYTLLIWNKNLAAIIMNRMR